MIKHMLDLLYPPKPSCSICGSMGAGIVCSRCMASLKYLRGIVCLNCGKQLSGQYSDDICPDCRKGLFYYERAYSCFEYEGTGKELVHKLKFEGKVQLAKIIAALMEEALSNENLEINALVPVPVHLSRLKSRGFNQSYIIALELGERLGRPVLDCLKRTRETKEQYNLDRAQRYLNINGAFSAKSLYNISKCKNILLVDDIYTTGSTVNECSKVLKTAGAENVYVITAATGSNT